MGKHPIRCGLMCPLRIALTLGQVAHTTSGRRTGGDGVCGHSKQNCQNSPKSGHSKNRISIFKEENDPRVFAWTQTEALLPFCNKGWGSNHNGSIFNTPILEAQHLWEKVHISVILACTFFWVIEEQKYE